MLKPCESSKVKKLKKMLFFYIVTHTQLFLFLHTLHLSLQHTNQRRELLLMLLNRHVFRLFFTNLLLGNWQLIVIKYNLIYFTVLIVFFKFFIC